MAETHENGLIQVVNAGEPRKAPKLGAAQQIRVAATRIRLGVERVDARPEQYYALFEPVVGQAVAELLDAIAQDMDRNPGIPAPDWLHALTVAKLINSGED